MTEKQFMTIVTVLKSAYPDQRLISTNEAFNTWYEMLKDIPYEELSQAVQLYIQTEKFTPTIAGIREKVMSLRPMERSNLEAWGMVRDAVTRSGYGYQEEYMKLPPDIQKAVGVAENLRDWSQVDMNTLDTVIQSQFLKSYHIVQNRMSEAHRTAPNVSQRIADLQQRILLPKPEKEPVKEAKVPIDPGIQRKLDETYEKLRRIPR